MKRIFHLTKAKKTGLVLSLLVLIISCQPEPCQPTRNCDQAGTVVNVMCGTGHYGNLWILLDNGEYLQPCGSQINITPKEGQRVKVGYTKANGYCYDDVIRCEAMVPPSKRVQITCFQVLEQPADPKCTALTRVNTNNSTNISIQHAEITDNCLHLKVSFSGCDGKTDPIQLQWNGQRSSNNEVNLSLVHTQPSTCLAYFERELSYDLSLIKDSKLPATIKLSGWNGSLQY